MEIAGVSWEVPLLALGVIGTFLYQWGRLTSGNLSPKISIIGAWVDIGALAWAFFSHGFPAVLWFLLGLMVLGVLFTVAIPRNR